jgi:uncharacterized protein YbdZ (MbtH family)
MREEDGDDKRTFKVVVNHEQQYSIWFADRDNAPGWTDAGKTGTRAECTAYIDEVWTDMRPLSLRAQMEELAKHPPPAGPTGPAPARHPPGKDALVERLEQPQAVEASGRPKADVKTLRDQIERGYVFVKFVATQTELAVRLDLAACELSRANFEARTGTVALVGDLKLNFNVVRYRGDLDLATLKGTGRLELVGDASPKPSNSAAPVPA